MVLRIVSSSNHGSRRRQKKHLPGDAVVFGFSKNLLSPGHSVDQTTPSYAVMCWTQHILHAVNVHLALGAANHRLP